MGDGLDSVAVVYEAVVSGRNNGNLKAAGAMLYSFGEASLRNAPECVRPVIARSTDNEQDQR